MTLHPTSVQIIDRDGNATEIGHLSTGLITVTDGTAPIDWNGPADGGEAVMGSVATLSVLARIKEMAGWRAEGPIAAEGVYEYPETVGRMWVSTDAKRSPLPTLWEVLSVPPQRIPRRKWTGRKIRRRTR